MSDYTRSSSVKKKPILIQEEIDELEKIEEKDREWLTITLNNAFLKE